MNPDLPLDDWRRAAGAAGHRVALVMTGDRAAAWHALAGATNAEGPGGWPGSRIAFAPGDAAPHTGWEVLEPRQAGELLGRGVDCAVVDMHDATDLSALCVAAGAVRAGGLLAVVAPELPRWGGPEDGLAQRLAPPPFQPFQVGRRTVDRLVDGLEDTGRRLAGGCRLWRVAAPDPPAGFPATRPPPPPPPPGHRFSAATYAACRTADQRRAVEGLEALAPDRESGRMGSAAVVLTADRGRGKSAALGLAASELLSAGARVAVTGPGRGATAEVRDRCLAQGAALAHVDPDTAGDLSLDVLLVDEAAALSVPVLRRLADAAPALAFATTVRGYEGTGQGFAVRFRGDLERRRGALVEVELEEPIRWASGDPVERWVRRALLLDAEPAPVDAVRVAASDPASVEIRPLRPRDLLDDEGRLGELFGLLVHAHYRTVPEDLARMIDGPNISVVLAEHDSTVVGALLLAREGGLDPATCEGLLRGAFRLRGNMLPETLTCHLAEPDGARLRAMRVLRLAVHPELRGHGVGRRLLDAGATLARDEGIDYLGAGFAATPGLMGFWSRCGYGPVRMAVTRSAVSGEHSAVVLGSLTRDGGALVQRLSRAFLRRFPHVLADALRDLDPAVAAAALRAAGRAAAEHGLPPQDPDLGDDDWRALRACALGPALYDALVQPAWELVRVHLADPRPPVELDEGDRELLVRKVLQHEPWERVVAAMGLDGNHRAMRRLRRALGPLVEAYGPRGGPDG